MGLPIFTRSLLKTAHNPREERPYLSTPKPDSRGFFVTKGLLIRKIREQALPRCGLANPEIS